MNEDEGTIVKLFVAFLSILGKKYRIESQEVAALPLLNGFSVLQLALSDI